MAPNTAAKGRTKAAPKKAAKRERRRWRPLKADRDALDEGTLTPAAKRMNRAVDQAFRYHEQYVVSRSRYEERMRALYERVAGTSDKGVTVVSADMKRRVIFNRKSIVRGNQNAHMAKQLIDEFIGELLGSHAHSDDERNMATFLGGVIQETKGRIFMSRNLIEFRRMQFTDERLRQAQRLLVDAFDVVESKLYWYHETWDGKSWVRP